MMWIAIAGSILLWFMAFLMCDPVYDSIPSALGFATAAVAFAWLIAGAAFLISRALS